MRVSVLSLFCAAVVLLPIKLDGQVPAHDDVVSLRPGDVVRIVVWRQPELSGEFEVMGDSTIAHPLFRKTRVVGVPFAVAEERVRTTLERFEKNPEFLVEPLVRVTVGGEVRQPNVYRLRPQATIAEAIAVAGGVTEIGRMDEVKLFRAGRELVIDLRQPHVGLPATPVKSGDQFFVPRSRRGNILQEYVAPLASVFGALGIVVSIFTR